MNLSRDYIIGAFIGGAAVSLLNAPRISSLKEDSAERQAQYVSKAQELDRQIRQAQNKDEIIELQRQQAELTKAEIDYLTKANESLYNRITELENRPPPRLEGTFSIPQQPSKCSIETIEHRQYC
jgi:gas vesicle protein